MLVVRGTKKLRDRLKGAPIDDGAASTTVLGDWFANALFWRPQVVLLVNRRTLLPVFVPLAPAASLLERIPAALESVLRLHGVSEAFLAAEREAMRDVRVAPTNDRSVLGVMNEYAFSGEMHTKLDGPESLEALSLRLSEVLLGPLGYGTARGALASLIGLGEPLAKVIPLHRGDQPSPAAVRSPAAGEVYQLKVTLQDTKPPVWRRVLVDGSGTLDEVHKVFQAAFGWWNYHLHEFEIAGGRYGIPDPDWDFGPPTKDERRVRLDKVAKVGSRFRYTYDFGDDWKHQVTVERVLPADATTSVPAIIDGRRACPPEDCGGTWGYRNLLEILADPAHPEHDEYRTWIGRPFDPETFDPAEFDDNLRNIDLATFDN